MFATRTSRARTGLAVDREPLPAAAVLHGQCERPQAGECLSPAPAVLAPVHEARVEAERDVVQEEPVFDPADVDPPLVAVEGRERADRVVAIEADVPGEVVAGPERDADERNVLLDRDVGDRGERAVPTRHPQHVSVCAPRDLRQVVSLLEEVARRCRAPEQPRGAPRRWESPCRNVD